MVGTQFESSGGRRACVTVADLEWGASWAVQSARSMIGGAISLMAANDYEAKFNLVRNAIQEAGVMTKIELLRQVRSISARDRDDVIKHLIDGGWIERTDVRTQGRTAAGWLK